MKIAAVLEDTTLDQFVVEPILRRALADADITVTLLRLLNPPGAAKGKDTLLAKGAIEALCAENPQIRLFILVVDRDGTETEDGTTGSLRDRLAEFHESTLPAKHQVIGLLAWQEVEAWLLALHKDKLPTGVTLTTLRNERKPKDRWFDEVATANAWRGPGRGRKLAMAALDGKSWKTLLRRCPELSELVESLRGLTDPSR